MEFLSIKESIFQNSGVNIQFFKSQDQFIILKLRGQSANNETRRGLEHFDLVYIYFILFCKIHKIYKRKKKGL